MADGAVNQKTMKSKRDISLIVLVLILAGMVVFSLIYTVVKNHIKEKSDASNVIDKGLGTKNSTAELAKLTFPAVSKKTKITLEELPQELRYLILDEAVVGDIESLVYQGGLKGFVLYGSSTLKMAEFYQVYSHGSFLTKGWQIVSGVRGEENALIEYKNKKWSASMSLKNAIHNSNEIKLNPNDKTPETNFELKIIESK